MSRIDQKAAMVNYFNSLLTEPALDNSEPRQAVQKKKDEVKYRPVIEHAPMLQKLSEMVQQATEKALKTEQKIETAEVKTSEPVTIVKTAVEIKSPEVQPIPAAVMTDTSTVTAVKTVSAITNSAVKTVTDVNAGTVTETETKVISRTDTGTKTATETCTETGEGKTSWRNIDLGEEFVVLLFKVAGVVLSVPLSLLGGIYKPVHINAIFGKPEWYAGLTNISKRTVSVVDTAKWMLPGKEIVEHTYHFIILLNNHNWGLQCDELIGTKTIKKQDVKWRIVEGDRPWLAGILKNEMCALLHVTELEKMLEHGLDINNNAYVGRKD